MLVKSKTLKLQYTYERVRSRKTLSCNRDSIQTETGKHAFSNIKIRILKMELFQPIACVKY